MAQAWQWLRLGNDSPAQKHRVFLYNILIGNLYKKILYKYILIYKYSNISIYKYKNISICSCDPLRWKMTPTVEIMTPTVEIKTPTVEIKTPTVEIKTPTVEINLDPSVGI